ncbi:MAG TPA: exodeoxyribonuclease VII large subunit, partial [Candidatus Saccharimonadales bacterium]|nr:exodeoxyribonuclease VII large subunit [Candidatus Saccharimonadales bacterium]
MAPDGTGLELGVSEFVALLNQTLEYAYPNVVITGELANLRVSKNRWLYFDLKDETATVKFFGTVYQLPGPLEDGMLLKVRGQPRLHQSYGFSVNILNIQPAGEGTIKRAAQLLQAKLAKEGLFDEARKRPLPYPPRRIGLIASKQSAAYADFIKILNARWHGIRIELIDVQVQGEVAPAQIVGALEQLNEQAEPPEIIVLIRGGGSAEDLAAFSTERVTRAVAASRVPTLAAIGHETDLSLVELAADKRASTPSNAAELLAPDRLHVLSELRKDRQSLEQRVTQKLRLLQTDIISDEDRLGQAWRAFVSRSIADVNLKKQLLQAFNPHAALERGYALVRAQGGVVKSAAGLRPKDDIEIQFSDGAAAATITGVSKRK